ncbi:MAG: hypothetical protein QM770_11245 [Tepidisphaeraceae bacterium]
MTMTHERCLSFAKKLVEEFERAGLHLPLPVVLISDRLAGPKSGETKERVLAVAEERAALVVEQLEQGVNVTDATESLDALRRSSKLRDPIVIASVSTERDLAASLSTVATRGRAYCVNAHDGVAVVWFWRD